MTWPRLLLLPVTRGFPGHQGLPARITIGRHSRPGRPAVRGAWPASGSGSGVRECHTAPVRTSLA